MDNYDFICHIILATEMPIHPSIIIYYTRVIMLMVYILVMDRCWTDIWTLPMLETIKLARLSSNRKSWLLVIYVWSHDTNPKSYTIYLTVLFYWFICAEMFQGHSWNTYYDIISWYLYNISWEIYLLLPLKKDSYLIL